MATLINTKIGENKGNKRIWIEGQRLAREGFKKGDSFTIEREGSSLVIRLGEVGTHTVSGRSKRGHVLPIIDIASQTLLQGFAIGEPLRIVVSERTLKISQHEITHRTKEREFRLVNKLNNGKPLSLCSLFHGAGVMDLALHAGFKKKGIGVALAAAIEIEGYYLDASLRNNVELWSKDSLAINSPIQMVRPERSQTTDVITAGIPCVGASLAGRAKNKLSQAEDHSSAGSLFHYVLNFIDLLNPSIAILENVVEYKNTASMAVIRAVLDELGYRVSEFVLDGVDYGAIENRKRLCVIAISKGLDIAIEHITPNKTSNEKITVNDILEDISDNDERWKPYDYLAKKEKSDIAAGKGFRRQLLGGDEEHIGTIGRGYAKARSTEPFIKHPSNHTLSRLLTPVEHARVKGIPTELIENLSDTVAHEVLGQSVIFPAFVAVGETISESLSLISQERFAA